MKVLFCRANKRIVPEWMDCRTHDEGKPCQWLVEMCEIDALREVAHAKDSGVHA